MPFIPSPPTQSREIMYLETPVDDLKAAHAERFSAVVVEMSAKALAMRLRIENEGDLISIQVRSRRSEQTTTIQVGQTRSRRNKSVAVITLTWDDFATSEIVVEYESWFFSMGQLIGKCSFAVLTRPDPEFPSFTTSTVFNTVEEVEVM